MPISTRYILVVSMDVDPAYEDLFNEVYDTEHVPKLLTVPGVQHVSRFKGIVGEIAIGGSTKPMPAPSPVYTAMYEIDDPSVLATAEWTEACEDGRWATHVRPHTSNRHHAVYKKN